MQGGEIYKMQCICYTLEFLRLSGEFLQYRNYFLSIYLKEIYACFTYFGYFQNKFDV